MKQPPLQLNSGFHTKMGMEMQTGEIASSIVNVMAVEMRLMTPYRSLDLEYHDSSDSVPKVRQRVYANFEFFQDRGEPWNHGPYAHAYGD